MEREDTFSRIAAKSSLDLFMGDYFFAYWFYCVKDFDMRKNLPSGEQTIERLIQIREQLIAQKEAMIIELQGDLKFLKKDIEKIKMGERV